MVHPVYSPPFSGQGICSQFQADAAFLGCIPRVEVNVCVEQPLQVRYDPCVLVFLAALLHHPHQLAAGRCDDCPQSLQGPWGLQCWPACIPIIFRSFFELVYDAYELDCHIQHESYVLNFRLINFQVLLEEDTIKDLVTRMLVLIGVPLL